MPAQAALRGVCAPPIHRGAMVARPWRGFAGALADAARAAPAAIARLCLRERATVGAPEQASLAWERAASRRRRALLFLVALSAGSATTLLAHELPAHRSGASGLLQIGLFGLLFAWVSAGFFTAMMGFWVGSRL